MRHPLPGKPARRPALPAPCCSNRLIRLQDIASDLSEDETGRPSMSASPMNTLYMPPSPGRFARMSPSMPIGRISNPGAPFVPHGVSARSLPFPLGGGSLPTSHGMRQSTDSSISVDRAASASGALCARVGEPAFASLVLLTCHVRAVQGTSTPQSSRSRNQSLDTRDPVTGARMAGQLPEALVAAAAAATIASPKQPRAGGGSRPVPAAPPK